MRSRYAIALTVAALAGCAVGPNYREPKQSVPDQFSHASQPGIGAGDGKSGRILTAALHQPGRSYGLAASADSLAQQTVVDGHPILNLVENLGHLERIAEFEV